MSWLLLPTNFWKPSRSAVWKERGGGGLRRCYLLAFAVGEILAISLGSAARAQTITVCPAPDCISSVTKGPDGRFEPPSSFTPGFITAGDDDTLRLTEDPPFSHEIVARAAADLSSSEAGPRMAIQRPVPLDRRPWTSIGPDGGAIVQSLAIDPQSSSILYAGTDNGIFRSSDGGATWKGSNSGLPATFGAGLPFLPSINAIAVDPGNPTTLYTGTGGAFFGTVFRSTDSGRTWKSLADKLPPFAYVNAVVVDPAIPSTIYAGMSPSGVVKSADGGGTWTVVNAGLLNGEIQGLVIDPQASLTLYAATRLGVYKTVNGGANWVPVNAGMSKLIVLALAVAPSAPSTLYASAVNPPVGGIFRTTDGGASWVELRNPGTNETVVSLAVDPTSTAVVYASGLRGVFKSVDSGASWSPMNAGLPVPAANIQRNSVPRSNLVVDRSSPSTLYLGTAGNGVFKTTTSAASWAPASNGMAARSIRSVVVDPITPEVVYAISGTDLVRSLDGGTSWATLAPNAPSASFEPYLAVAVDRSSSAVYVAGSSALYKSGDRGGSWVKLAPIGGSLGFISALAIAGGPTPAVYAATNTGVHKSTDGGSSFGPIMNGLPNPGAFTGIAVDPNSASTVYCWTFQGTVLYKSVNGGASWTPAGRNFPAGFGIASLVIDPRDSALFLGGAGASASGSRGAVVARSVDGGATWSIFGTGLPDLLAGEGATALALDPAPPGAIYAGTRLSGVYRSAIAYPLWISLNTDLYNPIIQKLALAPTSPPTLYAATQWGSLFRIRIGAQPPPLRSPRFMPLRP